MASFPRDQFDELPDELLRVGAHRAPPAKGRGWVAFAWAALATGVLIVAGIYGLALLTDKAPLKLPGLADTPTPSASTASVAPEKTVAPVVDPSTIDPSLKLTISILNGSSTNGLATSAGAALAAKGWPIGSKLDASSREEKSTTVYYNSASLEGIARGLLLELGTGDVQLVDPKQYPGAPVTIVLGEDYATLKG